jgi:phosphoenolpyruvate carboxylase
VNEPPQKTNHSSLRTNVSLLGRILGETIASAEGDDFLALIERIRTLSRDARGGAIWTSTSWCRWHARLPSF